MSVCEIDFTDLVATSVGEIFSKFERKEPHLINDTIAKVLAQASAPSSVFMDLSYNKLKSFEWKSKGQGSNSRSASASHVDPQQQEDLSGAAPPLPFSAEMFQHLVHQFDGNRGPQFEEIATTIIEQGQVVDQSGQEVVVPSIAQLFSFAITSLAVCHNRLTSLQGLQSLSTGDRLIELDLSQNSLKSLGPAEMKIFNALPNLEVLSLAGNNVTRFSLGSVTSGHPKLHTLNLSGNEMEALPSGLGLAFPQLKNLDLSENAISELSPVMVDCFLLTANGVSEGGSSVLQLEFLNLAGNALSDWFDLMALTTLARSLTSVRLEGNPIHESPSSFHLRGFLAWVMPLVEFLDGREISAEEETLASILFKNPGTGGFEKHLLAGGKQVMQHHLEERCTLEVAQRVLDHQQQQQQQNASSQSLRTSVAASSVALAGVGGMAPSGGASQQQLDKLQDSVKKMNTVVKVLRSQDLKQKFIAAAKIWSWYQDRKWLQKNFTRKQKEKLRLIRYRVCSNNSLMLQQNRRSSSHHEKHGHPQQQETEEKLIVMDAEVEKLSKVMKVMWNDYTHLKAFVSLGQRKAAITIQRCYRGFKSRQFSNRVKGEFYRYREKFVPAVELLQRVGRRYLEVSNETGILQTKAFKSRATTHISLLTSTVGNLQHRVDQLEGLVHQLLAAGAHDAPRPESSSGMSDRRRRLLEERRHEETQQQQQQQESPQPVLPSSGSARGGEKHLAAADIHTHQSSSSLPRQQQSVARQSREYSPASTSGGAVGVNASALSDVPDRVSVPPTGPTTTTSEARAPSEWAPQGFHHDEAPPSDEVDLGIEEEEDDFDYRPAGQIHRQSAAPLREVPPPPGSGVEGEQLEYDDDDFEA